MVPLRCRRAFRHDRLAKKRGRGRERENCYKLYLLVNASEKKGRINVSMSKFQREKRIAKS
jgi:hypothetical protein